MKKILAIVLFCFSVGTVLIGFQNCGVTPQELSGSQKSTSVVSTSSDTSNSNSLESDSVATVDDGFAKVQLSTSSGAQTDCSRTDATMNVQVQNVGTDILLCLEYVLSGPGSRTGETSICDSSSKFLSPDSNWTYDQNARKWSQSQIVLRDSPVFVPGSYRLVVKNGQGQVYKSAYVHVRRSNQSNCLSSSSNSASASSSSSSTSSTSTSKTCRWSAGIVAGPVSQPSETCSVSNAGARVNFDGRTYLCYCH